MRNILFLFFFTFSSYVVFAQDAIVKNDGSTIASKVCETSEKNKQIPEMYSDFSIGYASFGIKNNSSDVFDSNYNSNGISMEYNYVIKPFKKYKMYLETGVRVVYTFANDVYVVYLDDDLKVDGDFKYIALSLPVNFKYKIKIPNTDFTLAPYVGLYYKRNVVAKQKNNRFEIDFIDGTMPNPTEDGSSIVNNNIKYQKNQFGWQVGVSLEYKRFNFSGYYGRDFRPVVTEDNSLFNNYYGRQFGVSLGYRFDM